MEGWAQRIGPIKLSFCVSLMSMTEYVSLCVHTTFYIKHWIYIHFVELLFHCAAESNIISQDTQHIYITFLAFQGIYACDCRHEIHVYSQNGNWHLLDPPEVSIPTLPLQYQWVEPSKVLGNLEKTNTSWNLHVHIKLKYHLFFFQ